MQNVTLVVQPEGVPERGSKRSVGTRLRMLAVFSLPIDTSALNQRRERYYLTRLVHTIAAAQNKAIELRVLQYGVTRERLKEVLLEAEGWDVMHISGHGLPAGLVLERSDGRGDLVSGPELVEILDPAGSQIKLVTLSSSYSAATTAAEHLRLLGITPIELADSDVAAVDRVGSTLDVGTDPPTSARTGPLPLAAELVRRLDCAVVAMRYPVVDDFATALTGQLYEFVLGKGQPLARAMQLSMPRVVKDPPTPAAPALSVATPAIFGTRAVELTLQPPKGEPLVFHAALTKLAGFPPEPQRFVGRVGLMTRANAALAPNSGQTGVLLHGMAGVGKTACALELAYGQEQAFELLVWHKAPDEGHDITTALIDFALDLERKVAGLQFAHMVDDERAFQRFLPQLTQFLQRSRVLVVLDGLESLLLENGTWRDERWGLLIDALVGHDGLSRVILTSRRRPRALDSRIVIEPIHTLSLPEAVLLAHELPNLRRLLDGTAGLDEEAGRALVARTLAVVQGQPKLIELADGQAADPASLEARLAEADQAGLIGATRLEGFFELGESSASDEYYLRVLEDWTRATATALPEAAAVLFSFLCALEEGDRLRAVVEGNWATVWRRLGHGGDPPSLEVSIRPLIEHGLVAVNDQESTEYHLYPGVAEAGRASAGDEYRLAVDTELATYWIRVFDDGLGRETLGAGGLVIPAGRNALPYLLRCSDWNAGTRVLGHLLLRLESEQSAATLMPSFRRVAQEAQGTTQELETAALLARIVRLVRPRDGEPQLRAFLEAAVAQERFTLASELCWDLTDLLRRSGRPDEALAQIDRLRHYTRAAGFGPWTQLCDEAQRLQLLVYRGHNDEVLQTAKAAQRAMAEWPRQADEQERVPVWYAAEHLLRASLAAALNLGRWEEALQCTGELVSSQESRGARVVQVTRTKLSNYGPLLHLGRLDRARELVVACQDVFEAEGDAGDRGRAYSALAYLEDELNRSDAAVRLEHTALRWKYLELDPDSIAKSHFNLASYLVRAGSSESEVLAHRLAAGLIQHATGSGELLRTLRVLSLHPADASDSGVLPHSYAELCERVEQVEGVGFHGLVDNLLTSPDEALAEVLVLARRLPGNERVDIEGHLKRWEPVIAAVVYAVRGDQEATRLLTPFLQHLGAQADWISLTRVLRRIMAGERGSELLAELDAVDTSIVQRILHLLETSDALTFTHRRALSLAPAIPKDLQPVLAAVLAASRGNQEAVAGLDPLLKRFEENPRRSALAGALRRILAGERGDDLITGLDPISAAAIADLLEAARVETTDARTGVQDDIAVRRPQAVPFSLLGDQPHTSGPDPLGFDDIAADLAGLVVASMKSTPFTIGIEGGWGMGKSTLMQRLRQKLSPDPSTRQKQLWNPRWPLQKASSSPEIKTVWFNAWTAEGGSVLEGLIKSVLDELDPNTLRRIIRRTGGSGWLRLTVTVVAGFFRFGRLVDEVWERLIHDPRARNKAKDLMVQMMKDWMSRGGTASSERVLVVFVDDLDRCSPANVFEIFEAIKLYLDAPGFVFVIGYDQSVILDAVLEHKKYKSVRSRDYLEKVIQIGYRILPPDDRGGQRLLDIYVDHSDTSHLFDESTRSLVIERNARNPRRIKRFINSFILAYGLDPDWERLGPEKLVKVLILYLYFQDFAKLFELRTSKDPIMEFLDYVNVRDGLQEALRTPASSDSPIWASIDAVFDSYKLVRPDRGRADSFPAALQRLEEQLPESFPALVKDEHFVSLLRSLSSETDREQIRSKLEGRRYYDDLPTSEIIESTNEFTGGKPLAGLHILWIHENPDNNRRLIELIEGHGGQVVTAEDYDSAGQYLSTGSRSVNLLISTIVGPEGDDAGLRYLEKLRSEGAYGGPVVFFASRITPAQRKAAYELGAVGVTGNEMELLDILLRESGETLKTVDAPR